VPADLLQQQARHLLLPALHTGVRSTSRSRAPLLPSNTQLLPIFLLPRQTLFSSKQGKPDRLTFVLSTFLEIAQLAQQSSIPISSGTIHVYTTSLHCLRRYDESFQITANSSQIASSNYGYPPHWSSLRYGSEVDQNCSASL
jgi:hypothetical protein